MSFIEVLPGSDFPIENLPYGIFSTNQNPIKRIGVAIGNEILDLSAIKHMFYGPELQDNINVFDESTLNAFMSLSRAAWHEARNTLQQLLSKDCSSIRDDRLLRETAFVKQSEAIMHLPCEIGDYTDFFSSIHHVNNACKMFGTPMAQNWKWFPVGYHGRASSIVVSGTPIRRPYGHFISENAEKPIYGPSQQFDFELETAFLVGGPETKVGESIPMENIDDHIFGMVLMNDWSARDIQRYESTPMGPFLGKSMGTSISPWIVTMDALKPFVVDNVKQDASPYSHLQHEDPYNFDINLEIAVKISEEEKNEYVLCKSNFKYLFWTMKQQLVHHTSNGCNIRAGDLMGSGTLSGPDPSSMSTMLEMTWNNTKNVLFGKHTRRYLNDGDEVILRGVCEKDGLHVGFGECTGKILPA